MLLWVWHKGGTGKTSLCFQAICFYALCAKRARIGVCTRMAGPG